MKKIEIIIGSSARGLQYNLALSIKRLYSDLADFEILELNDLPFYNYEIEETDGIRNFKERVKNADGVIILTAEYNGSIHAVLKNALDWASVNELVFKGKPVFVTGATPSILGTVKAQDHCRYILNQNKLNAHILPANHVLIGESFRKFDEHNELSDENTINFLRLTLIDFIKFIDNIWR